LKQSDTPKARHTYEYDIELDSDTAPARVLGMVKPGSRVLEIGAGPGSITKRLLGTLGCDVVALEVEATAIAKLREFCPKVYDLDLNDAGWTTTLLNKEGRFDYVIAADVLEHVYDPWKVLGGMRELLTPTGSVILSLPHVGHAAVLGCLVDEDMQYGPWGLLDRTHIRFFGVKNVQSLYRSQGMAIEEAQFVVRTPEMTEFTRRWQRLPADVRAALQRNRFSHVYQVVTRAVPAERAENDLDLMVQPVAPADAETERYWVETMAGLPVDPALDARSTVPGHDPTGGDFSDETYLASLRQRITARGEDVKLIAFYLTQFHPIPENDRWWGKGFTEWTNVAKAVPRFPGHNQPHLPADLGYYDLRVRDVMHEQIAMAKSYGIDGFCYYYYWFSGHRLLERPLDAMLADPAADMPFCLCWANENWTRAWDAGNKEILIAQEYRADDDLNFIKSLEPYFRDPRYIRVNGAPLLLVYRPQHLPDARASVRVWREYCREAGIGEIHVASALTHGNWDYRQFGFDAGVEFPPHNMRGPDFSRHVAFSTPWQGYMPDYTNIAEMYLNRPRDAEETVYRGVFPSWDNTARRGDHGVVILNGTPENYEHWLSETIRRARTELPEGGRFVFINAWNEWAEGCHLEPCRQYGHRYLQATLRAKAGSLLTGWTHVGLPPGIGLAGEVARAGDARATAAGQNVARARSGKRKEKSALSKGFRAVRDTLNGRRFRK
jgi:2-polyprenyl-3-methyl-5-hydroxy-6-metoxy-1,4-benzoquinol methylase